MNPDTIGAIFFIIAAVLMFIIGLICNERDEQATDERRPLTAADVAAHILKDGKP